MGTAQQALLTGAGAPPLGGVGFGALVSRSTSQTIPQGGTPVAIIWTTEDRDDGGTPGYWDSGDPTKFFVGTTGYYLVACNAKLSDAVGAQWSITLQVGGVAGDDPTQGVQGDAQTDWTSVAAVLYLTAGQYVEVYADHNETNDEEVEAANFSISWIGTAGANVTRSANQSITNATPTALSFDTEINDTGSYWDGGSPTRLTFGVTGWYVFGVSVEMTVDDGVTSTLQCLLNGATSLGFSQREATWAREHILIARYMTAGDFVEFIVTHTAAAARNFTGRGWVGFKASGQGANVTKLATQSMTASTDTAWIFTAEQRDDGGFFDIGAPTRLTIPVTGWYLAGGIAEGPAASGFYKDFVRVDGTGTDGIANAGEGQPATTRAGINCNAAHHFTLTQYFELMFGNSAGVARTPQNAYAWVLEIGGTP